MTIIYLGDDGNVEAGTRLKTISFFVIYNVQKKQHKP